LVPPLAATRLTPNHVTTLRLLTGFAAALAVSAGPGPWPHVGGVFFTVSVALDRIDGELARLTGQTSQWGHRYDLVSDAAVNMAIFIGIAFGVRDGAFGAWAIPMGLAAGLSVVLIQWKVMRLEARTGEHNSAQLKSFAGFDADDAILAVPLAIWAGGSEPLLAVAAIAAPIFAVFFLLRFRTVAVQENDS
jgi:phosphatidylglycerophosphate synthase